MRPKVIAFDCFGTIFDMASVPRDEIVAYVRHVKADDFTPFAFPESWWALRAFPDVVPGIRRLREAGILCVTLSNGSFELLDHISHQSGVEWSRIIDLVEFGIYKPHVDAYRTVEAETGIIPAESLMVTANPTFGDLEGSAAIGMPAEVIRHSNVPTVEDLATLVLSNVGWYANKPARAPSWLPPETMRGETDR